MITKTKNFTHSIKLLAGITHDDEFYFLEIEPRSDDHRYFSMSGFTVRPVSLEQAKQQNLEQLRDSEYFWQEMVQAGRTKLGFDDWVNYVIQTDGELAGFDNSLFDKTVTVNGKYYIFESGSCGQHVEKELQYYFLNKNYFEKLILLWEKYHLNEVYTNDMNLYGFNDDISNLFWNRPEQDIDKLLCNGVSKYLYE